VAGLAQALMWHRQAAALALAADRVGVGADQLPTIQARLAAQRSALTAAAAASGSPNPELTPTSTEVAAAMPALGDLSTEAVGQALQALIDTLDAADAALTGSPSPGRPISSSETISGTNPPTPVAAPPVAPPTVRGFPKPPPPAPGVPPPQVAPQSAVPASGPNITGWSAGPRNALVYGGYSLSVLVVQVVLLATLDEERTLPLLAPFCLLVLPAMAWFAGWLTIGAAFRPLPGEPAVKRTPRLGVLVCLLPNLALCAVLGALFIVR
jgi:hypothetical protein